MWTWTFQFVQFANLYHLLQRLVVHVVCGPVHVVAHAFVQVVKVFLWDHVVPVVPWLGGGWWSCLPVDIKDMVEEVGEFVFLKLWQKLRPKWGWHLLLLGPGDQLDHYWRDYCENHRGITLNPGEIVKMKTTLQWNSSKYVHSIRQPCLQQPR